MSELQKYIEKRKSRDPKFAEFRGQVFLTDQRELRRRLLLWCSNCQE
jgi:hypothetical protein